MRASWHILGDTIVIHSFLDSTVYTSRLLHYNTPLQPAMLRQAQHACDFEARTQSLITVSRERRHTYPPRAASDPTLPFVTCISAYLPLHASPVHHYPPLHPSTPLSPSSQSLYSGLCSLKSDPKINASRLHSTLTMSISAAILHAQPMRTAAVSERRILYLGAVACFRVGRGCGLHTAGVVLS
jgi:hypothetical protein